MTQRDFLFLETLCNAFGPSGDEEEVRALISEKIRPYVDTLSTDRMGNLIATKGNPDNLILTAHMDEVGFMVTGIMEDGSLRFSQIGGVDPAFLPSKRVVIGKHRVTGVIGAKPVHLNKNEKGHLSYKDLYIHLGTTSHKESEKLVSIGDSAVFDTRFSHSSLSEGVLFGKAADNRLGCFILSKLIEEHKISDGTFLFTVGEENGLRGASSYLANHPFELGLAIDTTTANDLPGIKGVDAVCRLGDGAVISFADGATVYSRDMIRKIFSLLSEEGIPAQTKRKRTGGNEASAIEKSGLGAKSISVSVPCRYIHAPCSVVWVKDIENTINAIACIVKMRKEFEHD